MITHLLNTTMDVYTIEDAQDPDTGGIEETEVLKHSNLPCLIESASGTQRTILGREGVVITHFVYCDAGPEIIEKDRIKIAGKSYDTELVDDVQGKSHHLEIAVIERR